MFRITLDETTSGQSPFQKGFDSLPSKAAVKATAALAQMENENLGDHKSVGVGLSERRINFEKGYRIYYAMDGTDLVVLFAGGTKERQSTDIARAKEYLADYKKRKREQT